MASRDHGDPLHHSYRGAADVRTTYPSSFPHRFSITAVQCYVAAMSWAIPVTKELVCCLLLALFCSSSLGHHQVPSCCEGHHFVDPPLLWPPLLLVSPFGKSWPDIHLVPSSCRASPLTTAFPQLHFVFLILLAWPVPLLTPMWCWRGRNLTRKYCQNNAFGDPMWHNRERDIMKIKQWCHNQPCLTV